MRTTSARVFGRQSTRASTLRERITKVNDLCMRARMHILHIYICNHARRPPFEWGGSRRRVQDPTARRTLEVRVSSETANCCRRIENTVVAADAGECSRLCVDIENPLKKNNGVPSVFFTNLTLAYICIRYTASIDANLGWSDVVTNRPAPPNRLVSPTFERRHTHTHKLFHHRQSALIDCVARCKKCCRFD